MSTILDLIKKENIQTVAGLFELHPECWRQEELFDDLPEHASHCCLIGAIRLMYKKTEDQVPIIQKLSSKIGEYTSITNWNDRPNRTVREVIELCKAMGV